MQRDNNIPKGYKLSPFGPIPNNWEIKELNEVVDFLDGKRKPIKDADRAKMRGIYPYYGASGIIDYVNDYIFDEELILLGEDGANIINRSTPLAFRVSGKIWVNNHAHVLKPKKDTSLGFLTEFLESIKYDKYNTGTAQPKLNKEVCSAIPVIQPPLKEQTAIANLLNTWDKAINTLTQLIAQKELRKKWLMQQLLTGKKRLRGFKEKWEEVELGELLNYEQPTSYLVKDTLYNDKYPTPVLTAGKTFVLGYTNEENGICTDLPVIIFDDFTTASKYVDFPFKAKSSAMKLLRPKATANVKFVFEAMQLMKYAIGGHERHWISKFVYLTIPCPPIEEQTAIARVLQSADAELKLLNQKLDKLKEQKKGLMQVLLTGKKRLNY